MNLILHGIFGFGGVCALGIVMGVPRRFLCHTGLAGAAGWVVYVGMKEASLNEMLAMFAAACLVALTSHIFARCCKAPVTVFLITEILPLVPGVAIYRIAYYMMQEDNKMAGHYLVYSLQMAGMIAVAILLVDTIFKISGRRKILSAR